MPCSPENFYKATNGAVTSRWDNIVEALKEPIRSTFELEVYASQPNRVSVMTVNVWQECILSFNPRFSSKWDFAPLHNVFATVCCIHPVT